MQDKLETIRPQQTGNQGLISVEQQRALGEIQGALIIAKNYPRDIVAIRDRVLNACSRPRMAQQAVYQYARAGNDITGASIRLAEMLLQQYGNAIAGVAELTRRDGESECIAYCWDLENNYRDEKKFTVRHVRNTKRGSYKLEDERDLYEHIMNFGQRRKRACILAVIPGDIVDEAVEHCESTLKAAADVTPERIKKLTEEFGKFGVTKKQIETRIQRHLESMTPAQMVQLGKVFLSLKDGMSSAGDWFEVQAPAEAKAGSEGLKAKLAAKTEKTTDETQEVKK